MKKSFIVIIMFFAALVLFSCQNGSVKSYYLIMYTPAVVHEHDGQFKQSKPSVEIEELTDYISDSAAIASERERAKDWLDRLPAMCEKEIKKAESSTRSEMQTAKISVIRDTYDELANTKFTLLILSHEENYDPSELLSVIKENGIVSSQTRHYIQEHQLEVSFEPLN